MLGLGTQITTLDTRILPTVANAALQSARGFVFDGTGDYLDVADDSEFSFATASATGGGIDQTFSFAVWVKRDAANVNECVMSKAATNDAEYRFYFTNNDVYIDIHNTTVSNFSRHVITNVSTTSWQHWVITYNGAPDSGIKIYLNGAYRETASETSGGTGGNMQDGATSFKIGRMDDTNYDFDGKMMQAVLWKCELNAEEVSYLYAGGESARDPNVDAGNYNSRHAVVAWYPMDASDGNKDFSGVNYASVAAFDSTKQGDVDLDTEDDAPW
tara:strand:+ start:1514 stop:2329 length:816 start_codon:yes stop_codon:yes gene_type:complete